ncbi:glycosyltransferase family 2 protein [Rhodanobacter aciditrophus]|uniref:glycosyltransferase family 2 protein n=1 Tax=Rhodanobacter aciditrophus TaxID=1623218 RepID=UPI003CEBBA8F
MSHSDGANGNAVAGDGKPPRVSVVVPAYNNAGFLAQTIESILAQDYRDFELILADHSSTDGTSEIISTYATAPRVRALPPTPAGGGALANWNRVSEHARGELIKLVCGDDLLAPTALSEQVAALDANPSAVLVASPRSLVDSTGKLILQRRGLSGLSGLISGRVAARVAVRAGTNIFGEPACVLFRRDILLKEGGWDNRFPYLIDQATYTRIMLHGDLVALPRVLASFRISAGQWSVQLVKEQARQAREFHAALYSEYENLLSWTDVMYGDAKATAMAYVRRFVYMLLRARM